MNLCFSIFRVLPFLAIAYPILGTTTPDQAKWSNENYSLYPGDFDGDGFSDILYVSKVRGGSSGIALSDGNGINISLQSWENTYLGIEWTSDLYNIVVADFDGDGRSDVLLQSKSEGDNYLLITEEGGIGGISQVIPNTFMGLEWTSKNHSLVAGDFTGDGRADLFLQATDSAGVNAIVAADKLGQFTAIQPLQIWNDGFAGFRWSAAEARIFSADFNGDGLSDLLIQAQPLPRNSETEPVQFEPNMNGVVTARADTEVFVTEGVQSWSQYGFDADWSPLSSQVIVGDFNEDGLSDVLLQGISDKNLSYLLFGRAKGSIFGSASGLDRKSVPSQTSDRLLFGHFTAEGSNLFAQSSSGSHANYIGVLSEGVVSKTVSDVSFTNIGTPIASADTEPLANVAEAAPVTPTSAGRTKGEFSASPDGAATYSIPIWTPPGARGLSPNLSLIYSSASGDGPLGPGWSLSGLSSIERCPKTYAANAGAPSAVSLTVNDDFCLDGARLRLISGTYGAADSIYGTEIANFSRVTAKLSAGNGPSYFIVERKNGLILEYGNTADSKAYTQSGSTTPYAWMLNKIRDRQGNNLKVAYSNTSGSVQPTTISYTQTPATGTTYPYSISFSYTVRSTKINRYIGGDNVLQTQVLSKINVKSGTTSVRQYNFDYDTGTVTLRNRLKSIQECGGSAGTDCLRPTTITFQNGTPGVANPTTSVITASVGARSGDINGDGRDDLIYGVQSGSTVTWYVRFASNTGSYGSAIATGFTSTLAINPLVADVYGDGSEDLIIQQGTSWTVTRWNASTSAFVTATTVTFDTGSLNVMADTDGDGRPDLVTLRTDKYLYVRRNTSTGTTPSFAAATQAFFWNATPNGTGVALYSDFTHLRAGGKFLDFNGDGRQDIVARKNVTLGGGQADIDRYTLLLSNGSTFSTSLDYPNGIAVYGFANFNDDNCTDVILEDHIRISTCSGTSSAQLTIGAGSVVGTLDWDGDGRSDILVNDAGTIKVYRSLSDGFATATSTGLTQTAGRYMSVDSNGDALSDLFFVAQSGGALSRGLHNGSLTPPDIATSISDGWNISATFTFTPISVDSYAPVSGAVFPYSSFQGPLYVMKLATLSDGLGGTYTNSYYYYGARINRQGRGFQGFEHIRTIDSRNGLYYLTYYKQEFPYTGSISLDRKYQDNGSTLISETTNHFTYQNLAGTSCNGRCFPYIDSATTITNDLSATAPQIDQTTASFTYDSNGNPTNITTTKTDKFSSSPYFNSTWTSVVLNTYTNDAANWCISLPTVSSVANTAAGQPTVTRRMNHVVDLTQCRFQSETIESASAVSKVATTFGYDSCGNRNSTSVIGLDKDGAAMPARVTSANFGARCQFPESITNAEGETQYLSYDYNKGMKLSESSLNQSSVKTQWTYDNFARPTLEARPDLTSTSWTYEDCVSATCYGVADLRLKVSETLLNTASATVRQRQQYFDGLERIRFAEGNRVLGTWTNIKFVYDALGRITYRYIPYSSNSNGYIRYFYDDLDRVTSEKLYNTTPAIDRESFVSYSGNSITTTDERGYAQVRWLDVMGRLRRVEDPAPGGTTNYGYDSFGNLNSIADPSGATSLYAYNVRGFRITSSDPDQGNWSYKGNSLNELVSQTDANGQLTEFVYDDVGRLIKRYEAENPSTPTTWTYGSNAASHNVGKLIAVSKPDGYGESYLFDAVGRLSTATYLMEGQSYSVDYSYNNIGEIDVLTYPETIPSFRLALKHVYSYGFLQQLKDNSAGTVFWNLTSVNDSALPQTEILGNGIKVTSNFEPWTNELIGRQEGTGASLNNIQDLAFSWDNAGNLERRQDLRQGLTEIFINDSMNRLKGSTLNGSANLSVSYDAAGNITSKSDIGTYLYSAQPGCPNWSTHTQPHAIRKAGNTLYCYDKNGNMLTRGADTITWYSYNQPNKINFGTSSSTFNYDSNHQRWKHIANYGGSTTETTLYIAGLLEKMTKGSITEYRHLIRAGSGTIIHTRRSNSTNSTYYLTSDHLGSSDVITDSGASVLARASFTPFGARRGSAWSGNPTSADYGVFQSTTRRGFTWHENLDSVSLIHMNGRVFDPYVGRFLAVDPLLDLNQGTQGQNGYSYVGNNPLSQADPSGLTTLCLDWMSETPTYGGGTDILDDNGNPIDSPSSSFTQGHKTSYRHCVRFNAVDPSRGRGGRGGRGLIGTIEQKLDDCANLKAEAAKLEAEMQAEDELEKALGTADTVGILAGETAQQLKNLSPNISLGGFSTAGSLAWLDSVQGAKYGGSMFDPVTLGSQPFNSSLRSFGGAAGKILTPLGHALNSSQVILELANGNYYRAGYKAVDWFATSVIGRAGWLGTAGAVTYNLMGGSEEIFPPTSLAIAACNRSLQNQK